MQAIADDARLGTLWTWGWASALTIAAAGQFTLAALIEDEGFQVDLWVGGVTSVVGVLDVAITHPRAMAASRKLGTCPSASDVDIAFTRVAKEERFARAWYQHVLGALFNAGAGLYLGLAHDRWPSGAVQTVVGTAVSEAMLLSHPHRVADLSLAPMVAPTQAGYGVSMSVRW